MNQTILKIAGLFAVVVLLLNMVLFALRIYGGLVFWVIIIIGAVLAYLILPKLKKKI